MRPFVIPAARISWPGGRTAPRLRGHPAGYTAYGGRDGSVNDASWERLATALAEMARVLIRQETVQDTLDQILLHAVGLVDGCEDAGVLVLEDDEKVHTLAATSDLVRTSDRLQGECGEGPCFDAARDLTQAYRIADLSTAVSRWARYAPRARELGIGSMMGFLLFTEDGDMGALDMYAPQPDAFTAYSETVGWLLASHAAVAFSSASNHAQMRAAMDTRNEVGQAVGILVERHRVDREAAFEMLRKASSEQDTKVREIARAVTRTGRIPRSGP
jgi:transcriptional regulator with GAF, ATPase, and Fis domain